MVQKFQFWCLECERHILADYLDGEIICGDSQIIPTFLTVDCPCFLRKCSFDRLHYDDELAKNPILQGRPTKT